MTQSLFISPFNTVFFQGRVAAGAKLFFYEEETLSPIGIFADDGTPLDNPISADLFGQFVPIYIGNDVGKYRVQLQTSTGIVIDDVDPADNSLGELALEDGADLVGYNQGGAGAVTRTVRGRLQDTVSVKDFGAACDGVTDDTVAVQRCIDYCNAFTEAKAIYLPGRCLITSSLVVDRAVDTKHSYLRFVGQGDGAGFYVTSAITIFTSTLTGLPTGAPQSEKVSFEKITFESSNSATAAYVISKNFLRILFDDCIFRRIKCALFVRAPDTSGYAQQFRFRDGHATEWTGTFFQAFQVYGHSIIGFHMENGNGGGFVADGGAYNFVAINNVFEGCAGTFIFIAGALQITLIGNYTEGNGAEDYILTDVPNGGLSRGIVFQGNFQQVASSHGSNPNFWNVIVGNVKGMISGGNYCSYQMFDDSITDYGELTSIGDSWAVGYTLNKSGKSLIVLPSIAETAANSLVFAGTNAATATPITTKLSRFTSGTGGAVLPLADFSFLGSDITVINFSPNSATVYARAGDTVNSTTSVVLPSGASRTFSCSAGGIWNSTLTTTSPITNLTAATVADVVAWVNGSLLPGLRGTNVVGQ